MALRGYQHNCLEAVKRRFNEGVHRQLFVLPTASGKATIIAYLPQYLGMQKGEQMLILVHRNDLVGQTAKRIQRYNPKLLVDTEQGANLANKHADVIVASVQSISRDNRLNRFDPSKFRIIFVDEAHVVPGSDQYDKVLKYFGVLKGDPGFDETKYLGMCTATPDRPDGKGLDVYVDEIVYSRDLIEMMSDGVSHNGTFLAYLADIKSFSVKTVIDLDEVKRKGGDFDVKDLERTVNNPYRNNIIVDEYIKHGEDRPAICFTVDVQHAVDVAATFNARGLKAHYVTGETPREERDLLYSQLGSGYLTCLCSCGVMTLGLDLPEATVGLMARPTKSSLLFRQSIGRVLRPYPSPEEIIAGVPHSWRKEYAIVIDFVDVTRKHKLVTTPTLFGLKQTFDAKGKKATQILKQLDEAKDKKKIYDFEKFDSMEAITAFTERTDLLAVPGTPAEIEKVSQLSWCKDREGYFISVPNGKCFNVKQNQLGQFDVYQSVNGVRSLVGSTPDLKSAIHTAERDVPADALVVLKRNSAWRNNGVTDKQIAFIARLNPTLRRRYNNIDEFGNYIRSTFRSCGEASAYISSLAGSNDGKPTYMRKVR